MKDYYNNTTEKEYVVREVKDHYFHKAKKDGYAARSAYKLEEIDKKHHLLKPGYRVLDLGCCPGSWMQYTSKRVGQAGSVLGVDLQALSIQFPNNVTVLQEDVFELLSSGKLSEPFDIILSDMAPKTTGIKSVDAERSYNLCECALMIAQSYLHPHGALLVKAFQGGKFDQMRKEFQQAFQNVKICKPQSSRKESVEIFLLGEKMK